MGTKLTNTVPANNIKAAEKINTEETVTEPPMYKVWLHNDDYTPMDFVVVILIRIFNKPPKTAEQIMMNIHTKGIGLCGIYTREIAETKIDIVHTEARRNEFPLRASMEKL